MGNCFSNLKSNICCRKNDTSHNTHNECVKCSNQSIQLSLTLNVVNNNIQTQTITNNIITTKEENYPMEICHSNLFRTISESKWTVEEMNNLEDELQKQMTMLKPITLNDDTCKPELNSEINNEKIEKIEKPSHARTKSLICDENINTFQPEDMQKLTLEYQHALRSMLPDYEQSFSLLDRDETTSRQESTNDIVVQDNSIRKKSLIRDESLEDWTNDEIELLSHQYEQEFKILQAGQENQIYNKHTKKETHIQNDAKTSQSTCNHKRQRSLIRDNSLNEWTTQEVDELADEMILQVKKLKQENLQNVNLINNNTVSKTKLQLTTDENDNTVGGEISRCN